MLTNVNNKVVAICPPAVQTELGGIPGSHSFGTFSLRTPCSIPQQIPVAGTPLAEYTAATIEGILAGHEEVAHGFSIKTSRASRDELDGMFKGMLFAM
jgi:hypothetical protein